MKYLITLLTWLPLLVTAQNISVKSFHSVPEDMTARVTAPIKDQNGEKCALIKIRTIQTGFVFDGDMLGITKTGQEVGEIWLYVPNKAKKLTIKHKELGVLDNYLYPEPIKEATVYIMELTSAKVTTVVDPIEIPVQWIAITSQPDGADVYLNEIWMGTTPFQKKMETGKYIYRVQKNLYHSDAGVFQLTFDKKMELNSTLKPNFGFAHIVSTPESGASIEIDKIDINKTTPFTTDPILSGTHQLTLKKEFYQPKTIQFEITDNKTTELKVDLEPNFATLTIETQTGAEVFIDDESKGIGTFTGKVMAGVHTFETKQAKHISNIKQMDLKAGESYKLELNPKPRIGKADIMTTPLGATILIDGKDMGKTPATINDLLIGEHRLLIQKEGFATFDKTIQITENETMEVNETLFNAIQITVTSQPSGVSVTLNSKSQGATPLKVDVPFGKNSLLLNKAGYIPLNENIEVTELNRAFNFKLTSDQAHVYKKKVTLYQVGMYSSAALAAGSLATSVYYYFDAQKNYKLYQDATTDATSLHKKVEESTRNAIIYTSGALVASATAFLCKKQVKKYKNKLSLGAYVLPKGENGIFLTYKF